MKQRRNVPRPLVWLLLLVVIGGGAVLLRDGATIGTRLLREPQRTAVRGTVFDLATGAPLEGVLVRSAQQADLSARTDGGGAFTVQVWSDDTLVLTGADFFEEVRIPVEGRARIAFGVESGTLSFLRQIETAERYRKYRSLYRLLDEEQRQQLSEDEYLARKNAWRDGHAADGRSGPVRVAIDRELQGTEQGYVTEVSYVWQQGDGVSEERVRLELTRVDSGLTYRDVTVVE